MPKSAVSKRSGSALVGFYGEVQRVTNSSGKKVKGNLGKATRVMIGDNQIKKVVAQENSGNFSAMIGTKKAAGFESSKAIYKYGNDLNLMKMNNSVKKKAKANTTRSTARSAAKIKKK